MKPIGDSHTAMFLFMIAALVPLGTLILAPVPLSLDGPSHVYNAVVAQRLFAHDPLYGEHFRFNSLLLPNWLASLIAAGVAMIGGSRWSVPIMNALVVVLTMAAVRCLFQRSGAGMKCHEYRFYKLTILMPVAVNVFVIVGFWGFLISADLCLIAVGLLQDHGLVRRRIVAPALVFLGWWAHPVPVVLTLLIPAAGYMQAMFENRRSAQKAARNLTTRFVADVLPWCVSGILIAAFTSVLISRGGMEWVNLKFQFMNRLMGLAGPVVLGGLWFLSPTATVGGGFIAYVVLVGLGAILCTPCAFRWQLSAFAVTLLPLYFVVPESVGNGDLVSERVLWMAIVASAVVAVTGAFASNVGYLRLCALSATIVNLLFAAEYLLASRRMEPAVQELRAALASVPKRSRMLLLGYRVTPRCRPWPILEKTVPERHLAMIESIPRELIVLNDYEPGTERFPVVYRNQQFSSIKDEFDFSDVKEAAWGRALDGVDAHTFVVSWGVPSGRSSGCEAWVDPPLLEHLRHRYSLRYETANSSRVQVWQRRENPP